MRRELSALLAILFLPLLTVANAAEPPRSPNLCVLPVLRGSPGESDLFDLGRMNSRPTVLPGLAGPVLYGFNRRGVWTVAGGVHERYGGPFPDSWVYDRF